MMMYTKKPKKNMMNGISGLNRIDGFKLEVDCLQLLKRYYRCTCGYGVKNSHFPHIIALNMPKLFITMSWAGDTVSKLHAGHVTVPHKDKQINCILNNLERAGVYHLDMHPSGKNICIHDTTLVLIDFDIAVIKSKINNTYKPNTSQINNRIRTSSIDLNNYRKYFMDSIKKIEKLSD